MTLREKLESGEPLNAIDRATLLAMLEECDHRRDRLREWAVVGQHLYAELPSIVRAIEDELQDEDDDYDSFEFPARPGDSR